jgi:polysaccharide export outer membrane protein
MVKYMAPLVLVLLAACSSVSGSAPEAKDYDPKGFQSNTGLSVEESRAILNEYKSLADKGFPVYPDDELRFTVLGQPDLTLEAKVPAEGSIYYPMIGQVTLSGRSLEEIRQDIKTRLEKDYLVSAQVSVQVRTYAPKRAYVLGAVGRAGECVIPSGRFATLMGTVAQVGGFAEDAALHGALIYRMRDSGRIALTVDVVSIQQGGDSDPVLMPNDVVFVPSRERVFVYGQVTHPGGFLVPANKVLTATQAIALAGGYTRIANESNVRLDRRMKDGARKNFVLDLTKVRDGKPEEDRPLQPGDTLFVPESVF